MTRLIRNFCKNESGATAIEYALIGALVSIAIVSALTVAGTKLSSNFKNVSNQLK